MFLGALGDVRVGAHFLESVATGLGILPHLGVDRPGPAGFPLFRNEVLPQVLDLCLGDGALEVLRHRVCAEAILELPVDLAQLRDTVRGAFR